MLGIINQKLIVASRSFSVNLQDDDCLDWSQDNRLAMVTPSSVIVYDMETSCNDVSSTCLALPQRILAAPHLPNPHFSSGISLNSEGRLPDRVRQALLPLALSAPLSYASRSVVAAQNLPPGFDIAYTGYRRAVWSPGGAAGLQRCVLAMLTSDHRLLLACGRGRRLRPCLSLGRRWAQYLAANEWPLSPEKLCKDNPQEFVNGQSAVDDTSRAAEPASGDGSDISTAPSDCKRRKTEESCRPANRECDQATLASPRTALNRMKCPGDLPKDQEKQMISTVKVHIRRLSQLAIKLVCWCPLVTQCPDTSLWKSDLLHISLSGYAVVWRVTAGERQACSSPSHDGQASTKARSDRQKANENTEKEHDGSNFLDATVSATFDLGSPDASCAKWALVADSTELLLIGDVMGLVKVFRVLRGSEGTVCSLSLLTSVLSPDRMSVANIELLDVTTIKPEAHEATSETPVNSSSLAEPTSSVKNKLQNLPKEDSEVPGRNSSPKDEGDTPKISNKGTAEEEKDREEEDLKVLVVVARAMSVSALLLSVSKRRCQLVAAAHAYVSKMSITSINVIDHEHVYCSTRDGRLLQLSVVFHQAGLTAPSDKASQERKRKRRNSSQKEASIHTPNLVVGSPSRTYNGLQETVDVHRVEVRSDCSEHTEVISLHHPNGKVSRLNVVCTRHHGFHTSLSLRRKLLGEYNSDGASFLSWVTSPNSVFYATVESLRVPYDHLVMRESSRLTVSLVSSTAALQRHLATSVHLQPLHHMHDFLAACRILAVEGTVLNLVPLLEKLPSLREEGGASAGATSKDSSEFEASEDDALRVLQLLLWLVRLYAKLGADPAALPPPFKSWDSLQQRLLELLLLPWLERVVRVYHDNELWQHEDLLPLVKASLSLMCDCLVVRGPNEHSTRAMAVLLRLGGGTREQCAVGRCELMVELSSLTEARCADGHALPRCCVSLLPVLRPESCQLCATVLHRQPADALCGGEALCSSCGGAMESTAVLSSAAAARNAREGSKLLPKTSLVLLNSKSRKGKSVVNAQRI